MGPLAHSAAHACALPSRGAPDGAVQPRASDFPAPGDPATRGLNLDFITPFLAVGGSFPEAAAERLARHLGIGAVVDLRVEARDDPELLAAHGMTFLHLPTEDLGAVSAPMLAEGVAFCRDHLARGERVLVHCEHGIGRSATLALCVLVAEGMAPMAALTLAKDRRARVSPSPEQYEAWAAWLRAHRAATGAAGGAGWEVPGFDAFAAIAYRHLRAGA